MRRFAVLLAALTLGGCSDVKDDPTATSVPSERTSSGCDATVKGTEIRYGAWTPTTTLDPVMAFGGLVGGTEMAAVYDVLFVYDEATGKLTPKLAESIEPNADFTRWTLKVREGIEYSDGTPLTARLVSDNMDRFFARYARNGAGGFMTPITEKRVVDETTLEIELERSWPGFARIFADEPGMVVNVNAIGRDLEDFGEKPPASAGLGPYVVKRHAPGEEIVMEARDDYWDGPVCVETLRFLFVPESDPTYEAFTAGDLDVAFLRYQPTIEAAEADGVEGHFIHQDAGVSFLVNHRAGRPGHDSKVREALYLALDADGVNDRTYQGTLTTGKALVQPGSAYHSEGLDSVPTDQARARKLVEAAKEDGWDGSVEILCSFPADEALAAEGMWERAGIDVEVRYTAQSDQIGSVIEGKYDVACWGFNVAPGTASTTLLRNFHSESRGNRLGYDSSEMDDALEDLLAAESMEEERRAVAEVNRIFTRDFVAVSYAALEEGIIWAPNVKGIVPTLSSIFLLDKAYIDDAS